jgi:hypothetical protein
MKFCFENNIILCCIPSHTSHELQLQPCDVGVFGPLKAAYREDVERLYRGGASTIGKQHFTSLYYPARQKTLTSRNIKAGWLKAGLRPLNPDRVVNTIQKPLTEDIPKQGEVNAELCSQSEVLQTPVTAEALTSLRSLIEQDTHMLENPSKWRLQKLVNAAQNFLRRMRPPSRRELTSIRTEQRKQLSSIDTVNNTWKSEGDELWEYSGDTGQAWCEKSFCGKRETWSEA